jgi:hypothetical protein
MVEVFEVRRLMMKLLIKTIILTAIFSTGANSRLVAQAGPKNLVSPTYRAPVVQIVAHEGLTNREAKRLAASAESRTDRSVLVEFYSAKADRLEAQAAGHEDAAAAYRNGPKVKNLVSPTTAGRYEFFAKTMRNEAKSSRALAASYERMALVAAR